MQSCVVGATGKYRDTERSPAEHSEKWWKGSQQEKLWEKGSGTTIQGEEFADKVFALLPTGKLDQNMFAKMMRS